MSYGTTARNCITGLMAGDMLGKYIWDAQLINGDWTKRRHLKNLEAVEEVHA